MPNPEIFISYAWGGESEEIANALESTFREKGIKIVRDKTDLGYKGLIREFMQQIGQEKCVVTVISNKYLKSKNCLFELLEIARNGDIRHKIAELTDILQNMNSLTVEMHRQANFEPIIAAIEKKLEEDRK